MLAGVVGAVGELEAAGEREEAEVGVGPLVALLDAGDQRERAFVAGGLDDAPDRVEEPGEAVGDDLELWRGSSRPARCRSRGAGSCGGPPPTSSTVSFTLIRSGGFTGVSGRPGSSRLISRFGARISPRSVGLPNSPATSTRFRVTVTSGMRSPSTSTGVGTGTTPRGAMRRPRSVASWDPETGLDLVDGQRDGDGRVRCSQDRSAGGAGQHDQRSATSTNGHGLGRGQDCGGWCGITAAAGGSGRWLGTVSRLGRRTIEGVGHRL